ncbi:MAG TPA: hypothetical protein VGH87_10820 [Polyangiaceae bacterium]|jgi:hypothetical protein
MNLARKVLTLPSSLLYVALVVYSRRRQWMHGALHAAFCASFVIALAVFVVLLAGNVGVVPSY